MKNLMNYVRPLFGIALALAVLALAAPSAAGVLTPLAIVCVCAGLLFIG